MSQANKQARDPLDGFRGNVIEMGKNYAKVISEDAGQEQQLQFDRIFLGSAALKLMRGVASKREVGLVMGSLIAQCEADLQQSLCELLAEADVTSKKAQELHFDARVSAGIINRLNQMVHDAAEAGEEFNGTRPTIQDILP